MIEAVDIFCGAGGLSLGLKESGIRIAAGIDLDPACRYPFEANIGAPFILADVARIDPRDVEELFTPGSVRVLAGCAPCQPFSGYTTKRRSIDGRWELLARFIELIRAVEPDVVTLENVPRLTHLPLWHECVEELKAAGYHVVWAIVDASGFGVPQSRKRLVMLASRRGSIALPTEAVDSRPTVEAAIAHLPPVPAGTANAADPLHASRTLTPINLSRIRQSRPAGTWKEWPEDLRVSCHKTAKGRTYPSVYGRMSWDQPAPTITTQFYGFGNGRFGHPEQDRALTLREGAILQSFPPDFAFVPRGARVSFREIGRLIGNAVPPRLAAAIGSAIVEHIEATGGAATHGGGGAALYPSASR